MNIALEIRNGQHQKLLYHTDKHTHDFMRKIQTACLTKFDCKSSKSEPSSYLLNILSYDYCRNVVTNFIKNYRNVNLSTYTCWSDKPSWIFADIILKHLPKYSGPTLQWTAMKGWIAFCWYEYRCGGGTLPLHSSAPHFSSTQCRGNSFPRLSFIFNTNTVGKSFCHSKAKSGLLWTCPFHPIGINV